MATEDHYGDHQEAEGQFEVQVRRTGQPHISRTFNEKKDAQQWARQMEIAADRYDLPAVIDRKALSITLGELVGRYRDTVTVTKCSSENERIALNAFGLHPICRKSLAELGTTDFAAYRDERLRTVKAATLKRELGTLSHLFEVAKTEWGLPIKENPVSNLRFKAPDQRRERRLKDGELDKLIAAARKSRNPLVAPIILFAIETGMRRGEILSVQRNRFDPINHCLLIPETKNGWSRTIPLTDAAVSILTASEALASHLPRYLNFRSMAPHSGRLRPSPTIRDFLQFMRTGIGTRLNSTGHND